MRTPLLVLGCLVLLPACRQQNLEEQSVSGPTPPPAAALGPGGEAVPLDDQLAELERQLAAALEQGVDDRALARLVRAEAISDRLLQAHAPVEWLASDYSLESRLRQLQALADRIMAEVRRGVLREQVVADVRSLHASVVEIRRELREPGGGDAPPTLRRLLAGEGLSPDSVGYRRASGAAAEEVEEERDDGPALLGRPAN